VSALEAEKWLGAVRRAFKSINSIGEECRGLLNECSEMGLDFNEEEEARCVITTSAANGEEP
jgi:hypothetical protein